MHRLALWNSAWLGWVCLAALVTLGLPLTVCMPLWCDVALYDMAARNVLQGGVHYRDIFDTNMPGVVWIHCLVRSTLGWSSEVLRLFDAAVLTAIIAAADEMAARAGSLPGWASLVCRRHGPVLFIPDRKLPVPARPLDAGARLAGRLGAPPARGRRQRQLLALQLPEPGSSPHSVLTRRSRGGLNGALLP
jgi:hypothetical protein